MSTNGYGGGFSSSPSFGGGGGESHQQLKDKHSSIGLCLSTALCDDPRDTYYIKLGYYAYFRDLINE